MKQTLLLTLSSLTVATLMSACSGKMSYVDTSAKTDVAKQEKECMAINEKLTKVDKFIATAQDISASSLEELAFALPSPDITQSNNKKRMLSDANKRRSELLKEHKRLGCEAFKKH